MWLSKGALSTPIFSSVGGREEGDPATRKCCNSWALMQELCSGLMSKYRTSVFSAACRVSAASTRVFVTQLVCVQHPLFEPWRMHCLSTQEVFHGITVPAGAPPPQFHSKIVPIERR